MNSLAIGYDPTVHPGKAHTYRTQADGTERCRCGATLYPPHVDLAALLKAAR